jgi:voltage-gated potassium channel
MPFRRWLHALLDAEPAPPHARWVRLLLASWIMANVVAMVLETVPSLADWHPGLASFEAASVVLFSLEYLARLYAAPLHPQWHGRGAWRARWCYVRSPAALIDLAAVLPSLLVLAGVDLRLLRIVRLSRLLRIAKLSRYSLAVQTLQRVLLHKAPDLMSLLFVLAVLLLLSSTAMYHLEHDAQPHAFSSIPATMWWGIVTLTTIGYGDLAPVTAGGRALGGLVAVLGIGMFALPAGLLGAAFVDELGKARQRVQGTAPGSCPHCGKPLP